jgi:hypothetical protein
LGNDEKILRIYILNIQKPTNSTQVAFLQQNCVEREKKDKKPIRRIKLSKKIRGRVFMRNLLDTLIDQCHSKYHLQLLFPSDPFILQLECESQRYTLSFSNKECFVAEDINNLEPQFVITGNEEMITTVLAGNELLSRLVESDQLSVKGGYRPLLFVESVLWLTRPMIKEPVEIY